MKQEWKSCCHMEAAVCFMLLFDHVVKCLYLSTQFPDGLFLPGPVLAAGGGLEAPLAYLKFQAAVGLLQLVHLLHEGLQPSVQVPHGVTGVLQQVHGALGVFTALVAVVACGPALTYELTTFTAKQPAPISHHMLTKVFTG